MDHRCAASRHRADRLGGEAPAHFLLRATCCSACCWAVRLRPDSFRYHPSRACGGAGIVTEIALLVSLFAVGLRLRAHPRDRIWRLPLRLATLGMLLTIAMLAVIGIWAMGLPPGVALLLAAILAPTDPVLASDVQVDDTQDRDRTRFSLSGEGGLNDGSAFPFVMLALSLPGAAWLRWVVARPAVGHAGGTGGGLGAGLAVQPRGAGAAQALGGALGMESFFTIGLIGLAYGAALAVHGYGFLAVFAAGIAMRHVEHEENQDVAPDEVLGAMTPAEHERAAVRQDKAAAYPAHTVSEFSLDLRRLAELSVMVVVGALLSTRLLRGEYLTLGLALILAVRPLAVAISTIGVALQPAQRAAHCLVRRARHRLGLLPRLCPGARRRSPLRGLLARRHAVRGGAVGGPAWFIGDAADGHVPALARCRQGLKPPASRPPLRELRGPRRTHARDGPHALQ
ncbi:cation:proton antiporter domain-containing protein [Cupriavidus basilensis]